jgi:peptidyl-prolyl cis-trans isomerase SurA
MKKTIFLIFILIFLNLKSSLMGEITILYKINNEIITNVDVNKEKKYLLALNNQLKSLSNNKMIEISTESLIREKIKKIELSKFYTLDQQNAYLDQIIKEFFLKLNLNNQKEFEEYLNDYDLTIREIKKKVEIETLWNQLIYNKYKNQVVIDEKKIEKKIINQKKLKKEKSFLISEILFIKEKNKPIEKTIENIFKNISEIGFENSANIFSISDSSKFGGNIGWIKKKSLSEKIAKEISGLKVGSFTKPIQVGGNFLILKLNNVKEEDIEIDFDTEFKKMINFDKNRQLEKFSKIHFNKIKINTNVKEL